MKFLKYIREARVPNLWSDEITDQLSDQILDLEEAWNGGVADFGDKKAAYAIERAKGYKEYISLIRSKLPASFIAYRSMSEYEYDEWVNGSGVGYLSFTFEKRIANAWKKFTRRKNDKVIAAPIKKSFVIMRGKEEESEIVVDGDEISAHQIKIQESYYQEMRLTKYLNESKDIKPKTKKFKFYWDNPMGDWLENERKGARQGRWGSTTGRFGDYMQIPTKMVANLKGKQGENRKLTDPEVQTLKASIEKYGLHSPVFINVEYDGHAEINEGNRRTLIAKTLGWKYIPVEIVYYAGGELIDGPWHPDRIAKVAKPWSKPKTKLPQPKPIKRKTEKPKFEPYDSKKHRAIDVTVDDIINMLSKR